MGPSETAMMINDHRGPSLRTRVHAAGATWSGVIWMPVSRSFPGGSGVGCRRRPGPACPLLRRSSAWARPAERVGSEPSVPRVMGRDGPSEQPPVRCPSGCLLQGSSLRGRPDADAKGRKHQGRAPPASRPAWSGLATQAREDPTEKGNEEPAAFRPIRCGSHSPDRRSHCCLL